LLALCDKSGAGLPWGFGMSGVNSIASRCPLAIQFAILGIFAASAVAGTAGVVVAANAGATGVVVAAARLNSCSVESKALFQ